MIYKFLYLQLANNNISENYSLFVINYSLFTILPF